MNLDKFFKAFDYPFSFINNGFNNYNLEDFTMTMFDKNFKSEKIDLQNIKFPQDIIQVYWYDEGINDEKPWQFIGILKYKNYHLFVYYIGECDYTGFDCQGGMKMYISKSLTKILQNAIPISVYNNNKIIQNLLQKRLSKKHFS